MKAIVFFLFLMAIVGIIHDEESPFLEHPGPGPVEFNGTEVVLRCSVKKGYTIIWGYRRNEPQKTFAYTDQPDVRTALRNEGITIRNGNSTTSILLINATLEPMKSNVTVICTAVSQNNTTSRHGSREVLISFSM